MTVWVRSSDADDWHRASELEFAGVLERGSIVLACGLTLDAAHGWQDARLDDFADPSLRHAPCARRAEREAVWLDRIDGNAAECAQQLADALAPGVTVAEQRGRDGLHVLAATGGPITRQVAGAGRTAEAAAADLLAELEALAPVIGARRA